MTPSLGGAAVAQKFAGQGAVKQEHSPGEYRSVWMHVHVIMTHMQAWLCDATVHNAPFFCLCAYPIIRHAGSDQEAFTHAGNDAQMGDGMMA